jgi:CHAT domain-containing protein/tetratricopeptide (TPR) repeat protein
MRVLGACAVVFLLALPAVLRPADDQEAADDACAQVDEPARERWLEARGAQLTPALGRRVAVTARAHYLAGRYEPARNGFALAVRIGEITGDAESRIRGLEGLGGVSRFQGRPQDAIPFLERAMREAEGAADQRAVARILGGMGAARRMLGELGEALALLQRQVEIAERLADTSETGRAHNGLGTALGALGRYDEALPHFQQALEANSAAGDTKGVANSYTNLGVCYTSLGNYGSALEAYGHVLRIAEKSGDRSELAVPLHDIGIVYWLLGAPRLALDYFGRSCAIADKAGEDCSETRADEGGVLLGQGRLREARAALERAVTLGQAAHNPSSVTWASAHLAEVHWRLGQRARARELLDHALETAERTQELALVARTRRQIAGVRLEEGQPAEALAQAERAAETARSAGIPEELWPALLIAGRAHLALARPDQAEASLRQAVDVVEEMRAHAGGPDAERAAFLVARSAPYQELVGLLADGGRTWDALAAAERSKGRVLLDVLQGGRASIGGASREDEKATEARLSGELLTTNQELRALLQRPDPDAARRKQLESLRSARRLALEDFHVRQYAEHPDLRVQRGESRPLDAEDVRQLLGAEGTVLLEYVLAGTRAYLFVLRAGASGQPAITVHRLPTESAALVRMGRDLRARLAARNLAFAPLAARLHRGLLGPAAAALKGARHVVIVPDGPLWELPFQALRSPDGRYLIEQQAVSFAPSLTVLRDMRALRRDGAPAADALLALGNPELGGGARRRPSVLMGEALEPLPEAEAQVRAIARLYDPRRTAVRVGGGARESWLKAEASHYRVLHLATHGLLDDTSPLYSQLVLAQPTAGEKDDGLLEAREILDLHLRADLAVLSACETGRGQAGAGEGLIGMSWAFFVAGCPATVASQWKVEAASTTRLMLAFHRQLQQKRTPAEALRLAALAQLRRPHERHPFYWAGFVAMGDADTAAR